MNIVLEDITEANQKEITRIYNYYVEKTTASYAIETVSVEEFLAYYKIGDGRTVAKAVVADGTVAGFCLLKPWNTKKQAYDHTYEYTVYLKPEACRKGIGTYIYKEMEPYIAEKGITVVLAVICSENTASYRLFEALGFERCGHLKKVGKKFGRDLDLYYYEKLY